MEAKMKESEKQAREVILELRYFVGRIKEISNLIYDKKTFTRDEREILQNLLTSLKEDLKIAKNREILNETEKAWFPRCISSASAHLTMKVNSHPIQSRWCDFLYVAQTDISMPLSRLESLYPEKI